MTRKLRVRLRDILGRAVHRAGFPGAVADLDYRDELTDQHLKIKTGEHLTCLSVNGREYYFKRLSGKLDGTGMMIAPKQEKATLQVEAPKLQRPVVERLG